MILFDTGEGLSSALRRLEIDPRQIETVFISHLHSDHFAGLPLFIQFNYLMKRRDRLDIFLPQEGIGTVRRLLNQIYLFPGKLPFELELHGISRSLVFEMTDLEIRPLLNKHLQPQAPFIRELRVPNKMQCYSFLIESGKSSIVYSSDISGLDDVRPITGNADLLVLDGNHIDLTGLPEFARENSIKQVMLTHLPEGMDILLLRRRFASVRGCRLLEAKEGLSVNV